MKARLSTVSATAPLVAAGLLLLFALVLAVSPAWGAGVFAEAFGIDLYHPQVPTNWVTPALGLLGWAVASNLLAGLGLALYTAAGRLRYRHGSTALHSVAGEANRP